MDVGDRALSIAPGRAMRILWAVLAVALNLAVVYAPQAPSVPTGGLPLDKIVHALVFALPVVALVAAGLPLTPVVVILAAHAPLSELVQHVVLPHRSGDPWDTVADLAGVAVGTVIAHRFWPAPHQPAPRPTVG